MHHHLNFLQNGFRLYGFSHFSFFLLFLYYIYIYISFMFKRRVYFIFTFSLYLIFILQSLQSYFIIYSHLYTLPRFILSGLPTISSQASLSYLSCCHRTTTTTHRI